MTALESATLPVKRGGKRSRQKGDRFEREVVAALQALGIAAEKMPMSGALGGRWGSDISCPVQGIDRKLECKRRQRAFSTLYSYLNTSYAAVIRDDKCPPLVVLRLDDFAALARGRIDGDAPLFAEAAE